jgi:hypothetical protein
MYNVKIPMLHEHRMLSRFVLWPVVHRAAPAFLCPTQTATMFSNSYFLRGLDLPQASS